LLAAQVLPVPVQPTQAKLRGELVQVAWSNNVAPTTGCAGEAAIVHTEVLAALVGTGVQKAVGSLGSPSPSAR
jgi:hypothetical protein